MKVTWIRHGQTTENDRGSYYGQTSSTLTKSGCEALREIQTTSLKSRKLYVSPSERAVKSAGILFGEVFKHYDERLLERNMGVWDALTYEEIKATNQEACKMWDEDWINFEVPEGESAKQQYDRVGSFVEMLYQKGEDTVVVAHGGTIRMALSYMLGQNIHLFWHFKVSTSAVVDTVCHEGFWYIEGIKQPQLHSNRDTELEHSEDETVGKKQIQLDKGKIILVTGGARSGKSKYAESIYKESDDVLYIATAKITGEEMAIRVKRHQEWRNHKWETFEGYRELDGVIRRTNKQHILLDCVTIFTSNFMFEEDTPFEERSHEEQEKVLHAAKQEMEKLLKATREASKTLVLVTNEVGNGVVPAYPLGRIYRDYIGIINVMVAKYADEVYEVKCGLPIRLK